MRASVEVAGVPAMTVSEVRERLVELYGRALEDGRPLAGLPAVMLWGPPGIGKSQGVRQVASELEARTGARVEVTDVRLALFSPIDLRGIPVPDAGRGLAVWLRPEVFAMDASADVVNILFLDEITAATPAVEAAAYQIALDRACGEHRLPDNCAVICAGNRVSDRSVAFRMPKALANRLLHVDVALDATSWHEWAVRTGVCDKIQAFLAFRPDRLMDTEASEADVAFATPRSWEMASRVIDALGGDVELAHPLVAGLVGVGAATELLTWSRVFGELPSLDDIFSGRAAPVPTSPDALYALVSAMVAHARTRVGDLEAIGHSIDYARRLPADFSVLLVKDYLCLAPGYRSALMRVPAFVRWLQEKGATLDAAY